MMLEQSTKNMGIILNNVFHKTIWHIKTVVRFIMLPWMVLLFLMIACLADELFTDKLGRNGGMTGLFQSVGLHPHATYETVLWITGIGVFFAVAWLFLCGVFVLAAFAGRQMKKAGLKEWIMRKTAPLRIAVASVVNSHPIAVIISLAVLGIGSVAFVNLSPTTNPTEGRRYVMPLPIEQVSPYSHVLLEVPNKPMGKHPAGMVMSATHTISGKAVVTQTGPHTYQVRMIP